MKAAKSKMAIIYDFDGTLAPGNMQEYDFLPDLQIPPSKFWKEVKELTKKHNADEILMYMYLTLKKANEKDISIHRTTFNSYGSKITYFPGVEDWFTQINNFAKSKGIILEHYIISSGLYEMIEGTSIFKRFQVVFASSFLYNADNVATGPSLAMNYTAKTQFIFRINKGIFNVYDNTQINKYIKEEDRYIPFKNMIYIGDGETDIPCMSLVKSKGGFSIAVFKKKTKGAKEKAMRLFKDGRVSAIAPADYTPPEKLSHLVKTIIEHESVNSNLSKQIEDLCKADSSSATPHPHTP